MGRPWFERSIDSAGWHTVVIRLGRWVFSSARDTINYDNSRFYQVTIRREPKP